MNKLKISQKISLTVFGFAFIPVLILFLVIIMNIEKKEENDKIFLLKSSANQIYANIQKTVELCNMSTQVVLTNRNLINYLKQIHSGEKISIENMISFMREDIANMERLIVSNPYLYQIRVYVDSNKMLEMIPILFRKNRMKNIPIERNEEVQNYWAYDYTNDLLGLSIEKGEHIMALITKIPSYQYGNLGYIEVAVKMENVFTGLFENSDVRWCCFIDKNGNQFYNKEKENVWNSYTEDIISEVFNNKQEFSKKVKIQGKTMLMVSKPIPELDGNYIEVISLDEIGNNFFQMRWFYLFILIGIMTILLGVIHFVVKTMVKRFYIILEAIKEVQSGNLNVIVPNCGTDELGELAAQIQIMIKRIGILMKDNLDREILVKNSEIRVLQNQINAHFIYNVLESVKMMAEIDEKYDISDAVTSLGIMLRYSMKGLTENVTVKQEIEYIQNYIALMNLRFEYEIYLSLNIPEILWKQEIPKMSLQPIVENAICHGIEDIAEDTNIYIKGVVMNHHFMIEITDQGRGMTVDELEHLEARLNGELEVDREAGSGIGLKNVQDRIQIHFGKEYGIWISSRYGCYTKVSMKIPFKSSI